jgi:hypothetical protein
MTDVTYPIQEVECNNERMWTKRVVLCLVLLTSLPSSAVDAQGFIRPESCSFLSREHLHLESIDGHKLAKPIIFVLPELGAWENIRNKSFDDIAISCEHPAECESVAHSKIRIQRVTRSIFIPFRGRRINGLVGDFSVELSAGRKIDGAFRAKTRNPKQPMICE